MNGRLPAGRVKESLWNLLFPARCLVCGERIEPGGVFCNHCRKSSLGPPLERRYSLEGSGAEGLWIISPMEHRGGWRNSLYRFKFRGKRALAAPFGRAMADALRQASGQTFDCVAWVPLTDRRRWKRGYDQSELLARAVARELGLPCVPLLEKVKNTRIQHDLSRREREKNIKNAYRADRQAEGKRILLVDDIVTTGATLRECAAALYKAGAGRIFCLCASDAQLS